MATQLTLDELESLLDSWLLSMRAERKSDQTIRLRRQGIRRFLAWTRATDVPPRLNKDTVNGFVVDLLVDSEPGTAVAYQAAVRRFSAWLFAEQEIDADELIGLKRPALDEKPLKPLDADELVALFRECHGPTFKHKRDEALARFMAEGLTRAEDTLSMTVTGTNIRQGTAAIIAKGRKARLIPFGPQTGVCLDRYLRARRTHRLADSDAFWLGERGRTFAYAGLYAALIKRAEAAGIVNFHPHRLRATGATRWLAAGGSESGLMAVAGWESPEMLIRYVKHTQQVRAVDEARGLGLGDL